MYFLIQGRALMIRSHASGYNAIIAEKRVLLPLFQMTERERVREWGGGRIEGERTTTHIHASWNLH